MYSSNFNEKEKLWSNLSTPPLYNSTVSLGQVLLSGLSIHGSKIAQISDDTGIRMSFNEIHTQTIRAAQNLKIRGYKQKQIFGFLTRNSDNLTAIVLASFCMGCPTHTLFPSFTPEDIVYSFKTTEPSLIFCDVEFYDKIVECMKELGSNVEVFTFFGQTGDSIPAETLFEQTGIETEYIPATVDGMNDTAIIVESSGTTGRSKNVMISHAAMINSIAECDKSLNSDDTMFCFFSLFWITGTMALTWSILNGATRVITKYDFIPGLQLKIIEKYKITFLWNVPCEIHSMLTNELARTTDLSSVETILISSGKLSPDTKAKIKLFWPYKNLKVGYGITELAAFISIGANGYVNDSVGRLINGCVVKIIDVNGRRCEIGVDGEICVKYTSFKCLGYVNPTEANKQAFDSEGFFRTGDIGRFDESGYLYLLDRKKELIKYGDFTIAPSDIETFLIKFPRIESVAIVGVPNLETEELPAAIVVRNSGFADLISEQEIHKIVADEFPDFMMLRGGVYFVDSMPKTPNGKFRRQVIRDLAVELFNKLHADLA